MPPSADELSDLGVRQQAAGDRSAAAASYARAIAAHPGHAVAYNNLASLLSSSSRRAEALGLHLAAHRIAPSRFAEYPQMHLNLAGALVDAARYDEAVAHYGAGLRYEPSRDDTLGRMVHLMQRTCDWRGVGAAWPALRASLRRGRAADAGQRPPLSPMHALTMPLDARDLLELSRAHAAAIAAAWARESSRRSRASSGIVSACIGESGGRCPASAARPRRSDARSAGHAAPTPRQSHVRCIRCTIRPSVSSRDGS